MIAGIYQLTPLKELCLSKCRTPIRFIMTSWRDGTAGAFRMGLFHGIYCLGCCWLLFVILFPLGHECWSDGSCHSHHISRENAALAPAHASRRGCRACALRCAGDCVIATPPHLQAKWQRGHARRNADDDPREVADPIFDAGNPNVQYCPLADISSCGAHVCLDWCARAPLVHGCEARRFIWIN